jgi:glucose/arabinose dehydrogenase/PKD repeat protein
MADITFRLMDRRSWAKESSRAPGGGRHLVAVLAALVMVVAATAALGGPARARAAAAAAVVPSGFSDSVVLGGLSLPTDLAFAADGRVFVGEKSGIVKVFDSLSDPTPTVFADLRTQVHDFIDRGLLGLTLDPQFPTRPYVYVLYTYNAVPGGNEPAWTADGGDGCPDPPGGNTDGCVVQGRLSRLTANGDHMAGQELVLVTGWCQQFPSHSIGTVAFGSDGALYASAGDGSSYNYVDYGQTKNPCGDPPAPAGTSLVPPTAEGGSLRSQSVRRPAGQPVTLDGSIIRVDPATGAGLPGNPFASSPDQNARRIVAYGMRNPFRFVPRSGTDQLWVGDVGWGTWEEIDRVADANDGVAENFGWPCYEGAGRQGGYDAADLDRCESLYATAGGHTPPMFAYHHDRQVVATDACPVGTSSISGMAFEDESNYPAEYDGALFFADAARGCMSVMTRGGGTDPSPSRIQPFVSGAGAIVKVLSGPGGDIYYVDLYAGQIHRIIYNGANHPPTAVIQASTTSGPAPLTVAFDGRESVDLDATDQLSYAWDLDGDGQYDDSAAPAPSFTYPSSRSVTVGLRVTDPAGASDTVTTLVTVGPPNSPPVPVIDTPAAALRWKVGDPIAFSGHATDAQDGALPASRLTWSVLLNHCPGSCHVHPFQQFAGLASGSFPAPDHEYPASLSLVLTAVDSAGATASTSIQLDPQTVDLRFATVPTGLQLGVGSSTLTAPATRTVIVGSANSVSAPGPQPLGGASYGFDTWSDGGAASHNIVAPATPATYTATFHTLTVGCPATPDHFYTIPSPTGPPAATSLPDGRVAFATLGADAKYYLTAGDITANPVAMNPLQCHGGIATDNPAVAAGSTFVDLFVHAWDNTLWTRRLTNSSSGAWQALPIGGASHNGPSAVVTDGDAVHLVVRGTNGGVFHAARRGSTWTAWENLGGFVHGTPAVAARPGGGIAIVARGGDNAIWELHGDTGTWSNWTSLGGATLSSPTVASGYTPTHLQLFVAGTAGGLWQGNLAGTAWSGWWQVEPALPATARLAAAATPGRVIVYATHGFGTTYLHYVDRWISHTLAPYTCPNCLPATRRPGTLP